MDVLGQGARHGVAAAEDVAGLGAGAHGDDALGIGHLLDGAQHAGQGLLGDGAGDHDDVRVAGGARQLEAQALRVIAGGQHADQLDVAAVAGAGVDMEEPGGLAGALFDQFLKHTHSSLQAVPDQHQAQQRQPGHHGPVILEDLLDLETGGDGVDKGDAHRRDDDAQQEQHQHVQQHGDSRRGAAGEADEGHQVSDAGADAAEEQHHEEAGHGEHLDGVAQLEHAQGRAAVLGQHAFADLGLGLGRVKGVVAGLAGDHQQEGDGRGDEAGLADEAAALQLIAHDGAQGEGDALLGADGHAHAAAHAQQHQHQGQLAGQHRDHLTAQADAGIGGAGGGAAQDDGHRRDQQQVQDHDHVRHLGEGRDLDVEHGDEELQHHQRRQAQQGRHEEHGLVGGRGHDGLLAAELEEIIEGLQDGRSHALLHPGDQLAVDAGQQQARQEAEQEAGEDQHIDQGFQCIQNHFLSPPLQNDQRIDHGQRKGDHSPQRVVVDDAAVQVMHEAEVVTPVVLEAPEQVSAAHLGEHGVLAAVEEAVLGLHLLALVLADGVVLGGDGHDADGEQGDHEEHQPVHRVPDAHGLDGAGGGLGSAGAHGDSA